MDRVRLYGNGACCCFGLTSLCCCWGHMTIPNRWYCRRYQVLVINAKYIRSVLPTVKFVQVDYYSMWEELQVLPWKFILVSVSLTNSFELFLIAARAFERQKSLWPAGNLNNTSHICLEWHKVCCFFLFGRMRQYAELRPPASCHWSTVSLLSLELSD